MGCCWGGGLYNATHLWNVALQHEELVMTVLHILAGCQRQHLVGFLKSYWKDLTLFLPFIPHTFPYLWVPDLLSIKENHLLTLVHWAPILKPVYCFYYGVMSMFVSLDFFFYLGHMLVFIVIGKGEILNPSLPDFVLLYAAIRSPYVCYAIPI